MRVVMFGYQTWGHRTLGALLAEHDVVAVVTHPPSDHAYERIWSDSVAELAVAHDVPVHLRERPDDEDLVGELKELEADVFVATNWRTWIPSHVFTLPRHGTLNVHDSLLPAYGGFAPLNWALINGETEVGVTTHMMDADLDRGDIVLQRSVAVAPSDTATDLFHRTLALFGPITLESLELIVSGRRDWKRQDPAHASFFHKRSIEDSRIDWGWPAADIANLVRAQSDPYPNRFTFYRGERIRVLAASVSHGRYGGTPGRVFIREAKGVVIVAGSTARRVQPRPRPRTGADRRRPGARCDRVLSDDGRVPHLPPVSPPCLDAGVPPGVCHVWWARSTVVPSDWPDVLDAAERARLARFAFEPDRRRYVVAHVLARKVLADYLGAGPSDLRFTTACPRCGGPHGKPALAGPGAGDVEFSISHSGDWAVVGVARGVQIGVDVERIVPSIAELAATHGFLAAVERPVVLSLPFAQRAFAVGRYWVRKEATLKASGDGLAAPPAALTVSPPAEPAAVLAYGSAWTAGPVRLHDLSDREGHVGSVAVLSDSDPIVIERDATSVIGVATRGISTVLTESLDTHPPLY